MPGTYANSIYALNYYLSYLIQGYHDLLWTTGLEQANKFPTVAILSYETKEKIETFYSYLKPTFQNLQLVANTL